MSAVGFTGSRYGITQPQADEVARLFRWLRDEFGVDTARHGDCVRGDDTAAIIAAGLGLRTIAHPPDNDRYRAFHVSDVVLPPAPYLDRDRDIVAGSAFLVACPRAPESAVQRSGTWYTVRRARRARIGLFVVATTGVMVEEFRPEVLA